MKSRNCNFGKATFSYISFIAEVEFWYFSHSLKFGLTFSHRGSKYSLSPATKVNLDTSCRSQFRALGNIIVSRADYPPPPPEMPTRAALDWAAPIISPHEKVRLLEKERYLEQPMGHRPRARCLQMGTHIMRRRSRLSWPTIPLPPATPQTTLRTQKFVTLISNEILDLPALTPPIAVRCQVTGKHYNKWRPYTCSLVPLRARITHHCSFKLSLSLSIHPP